MSSSRSASEPPRRLPLAPTRRDFLEAALHYGIAGYAAASLGGCTHRNDPPEILEPPPGTLRGLELPEYVTLAAACERILPRDEDPGALDLGVPLYIDHAIAEDELPQRRGWFRDGLHRLDATARERTKKPFARASIAEQDAMLEELARATGTPNGAFFRRLLTLTVEGAYCDPVHGGNRDEGGWRLLGFVADPFTPSRARRETP